MDMTRTTEVLVAVADGLTVDASTLERQAKALRSQASLLYREVSVLRHPHTTSGG